MRLHPARKHNESFDHYKMRRASENEAVENHLKKGCYTVQHIIKAVIDPVTKLQKFLFKGVTYKRSQPKKEYQRYG